MNLQIECPKCSKRFTANDDLVGKTVECGSCDHRFLVKEESFFIERSKVYPGENVKRDDDFLSRLGRDRSASESDRKEKSMVGGGQPRVDAIMPAGAGQNIAVGAGISFLFLYAFIFAVGTSDGGIFQDMEKNARYVLGGFVCLVAGGLMLFGAKNWRGRAFLLLLTFGGGLFALIFVRPIHLTPKAVLDPAPELGLNESEPDPIALIREETGYYVIEDRLESLKGKFGGLASQHLVGIFIKDLASSQFHNIENYLKIELKIPPTEAISRYSRNNDKGSLIVISGFPIDFDLVVKICDPRLGRVKTYPKLRLIDLELSALHDSKVTDDLRNKLSNPQNPSYFKENLNELRALDPLRRKDAVRELAGVPENVERRYGEEIIAEFIRLIRNETDAQLLSDLGRALLIWATDNSVAVDIVSEKVEQMIRTDSTVPASFIDFLVKANGEKAPLLIDTLWSSKPEVWTAQYIALGVAAEERMIFHLNGPSIRITKAAASVLASIGTERALQPLAKHQSSTDSELKALVERAIAAINGR
jgi:DNA-directed RNA polymerase subunit RPC12/RpoP